MSIILYSKKVFVKLAPAMIEPFRRANMLFFRSMVKTLLTQEVWRFYSVRGQGIKGYVWSLIIRPYKLVMVNNRSVL